MYDPVPHLAALIDGLHRMASAGSTELWRIELTSMLTGPYAGLRGGLLLDAPEDERLSTEDALREALAELAFT